MLLQDSRGSALHFTDWETEAGKGKALESRALHPPDAARRVQFSKRCSAREKEEAFQEEREAEGRLCRSQRKCVREVPRARRVPAPTCCLRRAPPISPLLTRLLTPWQDFPHISEFPGGSGPRSPGPSNPPSSGGDWDSSYPSAECGVSTCRWVLPAASTAAEEGARAAQGWGEARPRGSRWPGDRASWLLAACHLHEKTQNKARPQEDSAGLRPRLRLGKGPASVWLSLLPSWLSHKCCLVTLMDGSSAFGQAP